MKNKSIKIPKRKFKKTLIFSFFIFAFFIQLHADKIQCRWSGIEKIVAIGDIHGDYKNFVKILKGTKLIDDKLQWTGGKVHLVQTGDIMDRGPEAKKAFDLLIKLEKGAEKAGGKIHALIGNHEEMNILGTAFNRERYVTVDQFISFLPDEYREKKDKDFRKKIKENASKEMVSDSSLDNNLRDYWKDLIKNDQEARKKYTNTFNKKYGKWILEHNAVIKINDIIFVHGGISEKYSSMKLEDINNLLRTELNSLPDKPEIVHERMGPLWYRGLAKTEEEEFKEEVDRILSNLNAKYMVIAHTPQKGNILSRFKGKIWIIDTGISDYYGGNLSALVIENGNFSKILFH